MTSCGTTKRQLRSEYKVDKNFELIEVDKIKDPKFNFRIEVGNIRSLAESIKNIGLLNPIIIRRINGEYEVVSGYRRLLAYRSLGLTKIPCKIINATDKQAYEINLIENIQRKSLNPIEEATAFYFYISNKGWGGITQLAKKIGKSKEYVSHRLMLLQLPQKVKEKIVKGTLDASKATELVWLKDEKKQLELAELIERENLTHREVREMVRRIKRGRRRSAEIPINDSLERKVGKIDKLLIQALLVLRRALWIIDDIIRIIDEEEFNIEFRDPLMNERRKIHNIVGNILAYRKKLRKECVGAYT